MMTLQERLRPLRATPPTADLAAWIAAWPDMRGEFEELIEAYERLRPDFHRQWTVGVVEELDTGLSDLAHRLTWLKQHLAQLDDAR